jgi:hypothetical protein
MIGMFCGCILQRATVAQEIVIRVFQNHVVISELHIYLEQELQSFGL